MKEFWQKAKLSQGWADRTAYIRRPAQHFMWLCYRPIKPYNQL